MSILADFSRYCYVGYSDDDLFLFHSCHNQYFFYSIFKLSFHLLSKNLAREYRNITGRIIINFHIEAKLVQRIDTRTARSRVKSIRTKSRPFHFRHVHHTVVLVILFQTRHPTERLPYRRLVKCISVVVCAADAPLHNAPRRGRCVASR